MESWQAELAILSKKEGALLLLFASLVKNSSSFFDDLVVCLKYFVLNTAY